MTFYTADARMATARSTVVHTVYQEGRAIATRRSAHRYNWAFVRNGRVTRWSRSSQTKGHETAVHVVGIEVEASRVWWYSEYKSGNCRVVECRSEQAAREDAQDHADAWQTRVTAFRQATIADRVSFQRSGGTVIEVTA